MLDGIWQVHRPDGKFLGIFETLSGNEVLIFDRKTSEEISIGDILHMDECYSSKAWEVKVIGSYRDRSNQFLIEKISDRENRYPKKKVKIKIVEHK